MPRPISTIQYTTAFERRYRNLPTAVQQVFEARVALFRTDAFHPSLQTHKLHGPLAGSWAFKVGYDLRVVFRFLGRHSAIFLSLGTHDALY
jgi:mRNA-degrading endonuclease YafQ of YafQ-DinJ toxin-antitoxin module